MSRKDNLIKSLHKLYREDLYINELWNSVGLNLDNLDSVLNDLEKEYWFDSITEELGITRLESLLQFKTNPTTPIDDRRSQLKARWISAGKCNIELLTACADAWKNGDVKITFDDGKIHVTFVGEYGIPDDIEGLKKALENVKPEHLAIVYTYKYLLIKDIDGVMTLGQLETQTLDKFAF